MNLIHQSVGLFGICLAMSAGCAIATYVLFRRRDLWSRWLDAEESFWLRLGFSKRFASFGRGFSGSRFYAWSFALFTVLFMLMAAVCAYFYFYLRYRLHR